MHPTFGVTKVTCEAKGSVIIGEAKETEKATKLSRVQWPFLLELAGVKRSAVSDSTYCYFLQKSGTNKAIKVMISKRPANIISDITHFPKAGKKS